MGAVKFNLLKVLKLSGIERLIFFKIRLPRVINGTIVGASLAISGVILQCLLRNPLAEPYTLGISGGASLGITLAVLFRLKALSLPFAGFLGALVSVILVYFIAEKKGFSTSALILAGVILNFLFSSSVLFLFALARPEDVHATLLWLMGDLSGSEPEFSLLVLILFFPFLLLILRQSSKLDILNLGDEKAFYLGIESIKLRRRLFIITSYLSGIAISAGGLIGFVGLLIPHFMRKVFGPAHKKLLIAASIGGASFLLLSDLLARTLISPLELPVGVITGLCGGFFFVILLLKLKEWQVD